VPSAFGPKIMILFLPASVMPFLFAPIPLGLTLQRRRARALRLELARRATGNDRRTPCAAFEPQPARRAELHQKREPRSTEGQHALVLGPDLGERRPSRPVATAAEKRLNIRRRNSIDDFWFRLSECHREVLSPTHNTNWEETLSIRFGSKEVVTYQLGGEPKCGLSQRRLS
jgi:hypothetical protein